MKNRMLATCLTTLISATVASAADWPTYRANLAHTSATADVLPAELHPTWMYVAPEQPRTGLPGDEGRTIEGYDLVSRVKFDDCLHVAVVEGRLYFGSSVDHQLHCVAADTGWPLWSFFTDGPVRLAPMVVDGRVYFGSDDGHAYCLEADTGKLVWKLRAGPHDERLLARGDMISRWPVRTSVLVDRGVAYFGGGLFPHENVYLYAVDAATGRVLWVRDNISQVDAGRDDLSPQGYLLASDELLFVPSGRSLPAAVDRLTGKIVHKRVHHRSAAGGVVGGTEALLADGQLYSSGAHHFLAMDQRTGDMGFAYIDGQQMAVVDGAAFVATGENVSRLDRVPYAESSRVRRGLELAAYNIGRKLRDPGDEADKLKAQLSTLRGQLKEVSEQGVVWRVPNRAASSLIVVGDRVYVGGNGTVEALDTATGESHWKVDVDGDVRGLAAAAGRLYASTTTGRIYCFAAASDATESEATQKLVSNPYPDDALSAVYQQAAEQILAATGIRRGFCLVLGSEQGRLAYELARRSELTVLGVEPDPAKVDASRRALASAGLYGHRIAIHQGDLAAIPYSNYFANLVVSDTLLATGTLPFEPALVARHLKPAGGVFCLGRVATAPGDPLSVDQLAEWLAATELGDHSTLNTHGTWVTLRRGALPGAGSWTHQYGEPGNTASSQDRLIRGGLGVLWYGDPGPNQMVNRHEGAVGPLSVGGRLIVQGEQTLMGYDAYNGLPLWEYQNPEAIRTGVFNNVNPGNMAASDEAVFMFAGDLCHEIDAATGELRRLHRLPPEVDGGNHQWGYVAYRDGLLFGTATIRNEIAERARRRGRKTDDATDTIFAIDVATGNLAWSHRGTSISHHTVAIGPDRVFFIDSSITPEERQALVTQDKSELSKLSPDEAREAEARMKRLDVRMAVALEARTGRELWSLPVDVTDCSEVGIGGGKLTMMYDQGVLVLCGANANGHYWQQFVQGDFSRRRLVVLDSGSGDTLWAKDANYVNRPIIVGDRLLAEPWAFNLYNGEQQTRPNEITGEPEPWTIMRTGHHCGMINGCANMLFFRSGFTGYYDLAADTGAQHFAGHRLGCWINAIPANGLVMIPEAGAGCVCLFSIESTVVLEPREPRRPWAIYSSVGDVLPVEQLAVNLGAPGDRRDAHGKLWLAYPRPKPYKHTSLETRLALDTKFVSGGGYTSINEESNPLPGAETPWVFTSWAWGLRDCLIPLRREEDGPANYDVKLYFADWDHGTPGSRVFDVELQGRTVLSGLDIAAEAGRGSPLVREIANVRVNQDLAIRLVPRSGESPEQLPVLCAIEVRRITPAAEKQP